MLNIDFFLVILMFLTYVQLLLLSYFRRALYDFDYFLGPIIFRTIEEFFTQNLPICSLIYEKEDKELVFKAFFIYPFEFFPCFEC